uniref:Uncharacterized protein n=1 Tax=Strigamia maritima TaxID=126957 RepID=T1J7T8_STRMM
MFLESENYKKEKFNGNQTTKTLNQGFSSCSHGRRINEKTSRLKAELNQNEAKNGKDLLLSNAIQPQHTLHSYDPVISTVKLFTPTSDDILVLQDEPEFQEENNIISRNNYNVLVLSSSYSYPPGFFEPTFKYSPLTDFEKSMINMAGKSDEVACTLNAIENKVSSGGKAKPEHLERIFSILSHNLPRFFTQAHDYSIYTADIEFNNYIRGTNTKGLASYVQQLALVRIVGHFKFAHVRFEVLKITKHSDDSTVRVRWRIRGITAMKAFIKIWNIKNWDRKKLLEEEADWYDGFSIFYVGDDGAVYRHDCDKMIPDKEIKIESTQTLAAKLAFLLGVLQRPVLDDLNTVMMALIKMNGLQDTSSPNQPLVK